MTDNTKPSYQFQLVWRDRQSTKYIVIHSSGTKPDQLDDQGNPAGYRYLDHKHRAQHGLNCGYHFVIPRDGALVQARAQNHIGNHCAGVNAISIGICVMGTGVDGVADYTPEQWGTLKDLVDGLCRKYPEALVVGHNEVAGRASVRCPGWDVKKWFQTSTTRIIHKKETNDQPPHSETDGPQTPPIP
jgi:N-acetyl-anhydromuramyl-L-alanine amidase AmpD